MTQFANHPTLKGEDNEGKVKRYIHQPLTIDHYGIQAQIKENGKVVIKGLPTPVAGNSNEVEYDEVEIPASLVFKLATFLKGTRKIVYVSMTEADKLAPVTRDE